MRKALIQIDETSTILVLPDVVTLLIHPYRNHLSDIIITSSDFMLFVCASFAKVIVP